MTTKLVTFNLEKAKANPNSIVDQHGCKPLKVSIEDSGIFCTYPSVWGQTITIKYNEYGAEILTNRMGFLWIKEEIEA